MIIFDRFLCCIRLKSLGKFVGWTGTMLCVLVAYTVLLVIASRSVNLLVVTDHARYFGLNAMTEGNDRFQ